MSCLQAPSIEVVVLTMEELTHKADQLCGIPPKEVPAMVRFHHDLGLLLHFECIASLRHKVVTRVPWLIKVTSALLHPPAYWSP